MTNRYDVCLSFAGEDRGYVEAVAERLRDRKVDVFYDEFETVDLWGKDLYTHLDEIFRLHARYCVVFISASYVEKVWPKHELMSAQARALFESGYILPARFDETEVPGLRPTVHWIDLRNLSPEQFAALICEKLGVAATPGEGRFGWFPAVAFATSTDEARISCFQGLPVAGHLAGVDDLLVHALRALRAQLRKEGTDCFWSHGEDRRFDRFYATSSVLTAFAQIGIPFDSAAVHDALLFLKTGDVADIDDRAASIFLLLRGELSEDQMRRLVATIGEHQIVDAGSPYKGSFLLPQGRSGKAGERSNWSDTLHADGATFHACHLGDFLLHLPDVGNLRLNAEPILTGIRSYLGAELRRHKGWLVDVRGDRTPRTLYGLALCRPLGLPLPADWRNVAQEASSLVEERNYDLFTRCITLINVACLSNATADPEFSGFAHGYGRGSIQRLTGSTDLSAMPPRDLAILLRAVVHGLSLIDPRLPLSFCGRALHTFRREWEEEP